MNTMGLLETVWQDLRYAVRSFRQNAGHTSVALLSLALGIGANTAIFSVVYGVLIDPYPYAKPYEIWAPQIRNLKNPQQGRGSHWLPEYLEVTKLSAFSQVMATSFENVLLTGDRAPEGFQGILMSGGAFEFLGVKPFAGRTILPSDIKPSGEAEPVVVLSYLAWQRLFDGDRNAIGKTLVLNDQPHTVIGVRACGYLFQRRNASREWLMQSCGFGQVSRRKLPNSSCTPCTCVWRKKDRRIFQKKASPRNW